VPPSAARRRACSQAMRALRPACTTEVFSCRPLSSRALASSSSSMIMVVRMCMNMAYTCISVKVACTDGRESRPVSRVLSRAIIPLGSPSPWTSSGLPGSARGSALLPSLRAEAASLFGLAPGGVYRAVACCHRRGALLPHRFTLAGPVRDLGGLLSVALSVGSRPPGVTWHLIRRSPDFPPPPGFDSRKQRLPGRLSGPTIRCSGCFFFIRWCTGAGACAAARKECVGRGARGAAQRRRNRRGSPGG
jgi:hypothetical protein